MSDPQKERIDHCPFQGCIYQTKSHHLASHITDKHSKLKNSDLIPIYDRVPKDGNAIMISKFQASAFTSQLDYQEKNISSHNASIFILEKDNKELKQSVQTLTQTIQELKDLIIQQALSQKTTIDNLTLRIEELESAVSKLSHPPRSPTSSCKLEEVKQLPISKSRKIKKRVKRFSKSKHKKLKKVHK